MGVYRREQSKFWYIQFMFEGKQYVRSSKTTNKKLAEQLERQFKDELIRQRTLGEGESVTFERAGTEYLNTITSKTTKGTYASHWKWVTEHFDTSTRMHMFKQSDAIKLINLKQSSGVSQATINLLITTLRNIHVYAKMAGYKVSTIDFPNTTQTKKRLRFLSPEEEAAFLRELHPSRAVELHNSDYVGDRIQDVYDLAVLLLDTGARIGEIEILMWRQIDLKARTISLYRQKTKNETVLSMTDRVYELLLKRWSTKKSTQWVFTNRDNTNHRTRNRIPFARALKDAGIQDASIHTLRKTFASKLIQNGASLFEVSKLLGHSNIQTTMVYAFLEQTDVAKKAAGILNSLNPPTHSDNVKAINE